MSCTLNGVTVVCVDLVGRFATSPPKSSKTGRSLDGFAEILVIGFLVVKKLISGILGFSSAVFICVREDSP